MSVIKPTVGRVVWFRPSADDVHLTKLGPQPMAALVVFVHSDTEINVAGFDHNGDPFYRNNVYLQQEDNPAPGDGAEFAEWMPYQKAKAEQEADTIGAMIEDANAAATQTAAPAGDEANAGTVTNE